MEGETTKETLDGVNRIAAERARQVHQEGWTPDHDDGHTDGDLAVQAAALAVHGTDAEIRDPLERVGWSDFLIDRVDAWGLLDKHGDDQIRCLEIAGALIAAEIDRIQRREASDA